jgi:hypothetical protein
MLADGTRLVQLELYAEGGPVVAKGLLFQAKKAWEHRDAALLQQVAKMEEVAPGGSAVFNFGSHKFTACSGVDVAHGDGHPPVAPQALGEFLIGQFLPCHVGLRGLYFDFALDIVRLPDPRGAVPCRSAVEPGHVLALQALKCRW